MSSGWIKAWAIASTALLLLVTAALAVTLAKPSLFLDKRISPVAQQRQLNSLSDSVDDLESCVDDDFALSGGGLDSSCGSIDSLESELDDLSSRVDDACDQLYRTIDSSPGC